MKHERVIKHVNRIREAMGHNPIEVLSKGRRMIGCDCPISRSIPGHVNVGKIRITLENSIFWDGMATPEIEHPGYIKDFIRAFDKGCYPDLIAEEVSSD